MALRWDDIPIYANDVYETYPVSLRSAMWHYMLNIWSVVIKFEQHMDHIT